MPEPIWNCPLEIPELRPSQLLELNSSELMDRVHQLRSQLDDTMNEIIKRWLDKEIRSDQA